MATGVTTEKALWRLIVVGGHTRSIGKTQLVCDVISAFPRVEWIAGKITQYGHGVCARNGENCDCAPEEHTCALDWETRADTGTDSARFLQAGAKRSFWLRTKQGYLAEGLPLLRKALRGIESDESEDPRANVSGTKQSVSQFREMPQAAEADSVSTSITARLKPCSEQNMTPESGDRVSQVEAENERPRALIVESNSLMQFVKPSLYFAVVDPLKDDFKESAQTALDRAHALVLRGGVGENPPAPLWMRLPERLMREKPSVLQREGEKLPEPLWELVHRILEQPPSVKL